jgi:hypothetical protein
MIRQQEECESNTLMCLFSLSFQEEEEPEEPEDAQTKDEL